MFMEQYHTVVLHQLGSLKCFVVQSNCYSVTCRKFPSGNRLNYNNDGNTFRNFLAKQVWCDAERPNIPAFDGSKAGSGASLGLCVNIFSQHRFTKQAASMWLFSIPKSTSLENMVTLGISEQFGAMQVGWHWLWYHSQKYQLAGSAWRESDCSEGTYGYCSCASAGLIIHVPETNSQQQIYTKMRPLHSHFWRFFS